MNLTFADINNAFSTLVPTDTLPGGAGVFESSEARPSLFADNLRQVIKDAEVVQEPVSGESSTSVSNVAGKEKSLDKSGKLIMAVQKGNLKKNGIFFMVGKGTDLEKAKINLLENMGQGQGLPFLSKLQKFFLELSGGDLNNLTLDVQGLDALKKMLLKVGFEPGEVEELISGLSEKAQVNDISLNEVMDNLLTLSPEIEDETMDKEILLETSALPFLISVLNSLGLPKESVNQIISQSDRGEKGISLDVVIDHLKAIETQSFFTGQSFQTKEGDTSFPMLLKQLGLVLPEDSSSQPVPGENTASTSGLSDFLASLKMHKDKIVDARKQVDNPLSPKSSNQTDGVVTESSNNLIDTLSQHLEIQARKAGVFELSNAQINDQFKQDLLIPGKYKLKKKGLISQEHPVTNIKSEQFFKDLESVISGKPGTDMDSDSHFKEKKETISLSKSESIKGEGISDLSPSSVKTNSLETSLKAKATFRNMPSYVMHQVEKSIVRAVNQGENTLKIQLKPSELGRLVMTIDNVGNSMKVSITTENPVAKDILASHMNELRTVLSAAGISLDKFDVDMSSDFRQSMADAKNQPGNSNGKNRNREKNLFDPISLERQNIGDMGIQIQDGSYHFVA